MNVRSSRRLITYGSLAVIALISVVVWAVVRLRPDAVGRLGGVDMVYESAVGYGGTKPPQYVLYEAFRGSTDVERLRKLLDDRRPILRCYALRALLEKQPGWDPLPDVLRRLDDRAAVTHFAGCSISYTTVADILVESVEGRLTAEGRERLYDALLSQRGLGATQHALREWPASPSRHARVRELAAAGEPGALIALARYADPADAPVILGAIDRASQEAMEAMAIAPDLSYFIPLRDRARKVIDQHGEFDLQERYFAAVAACRSAAAAEVLALPLAGDPADTYYEYPLQFAFKAAWAYHCPQYDSLLFRLWEKEHLRELTPELLSHFAEVDWPRTKARLAVCLEGQATNCYDEKTVSRMAELVIDRLPRGEALALLNGSLGTAEACFLPVALQAARLGDASSAEVILSRLPGQTNVYFSGLYVRAVLAFGDESLKRRLRSAINSNAALVAEFDRLSALPIEQIRVLP